MLFILLDLQDLKVMNKKSAFIVVQNLLRKMAFLTISNDINVMIVVSNLLVVFD